MDIVPSCSTSHPIRQSSRLTKPPICTQDYICPTLAQPSPHSISNFLSYSKLSTPYKAFLTSISSFQEPATYHDAILDPRWRDAMDLELAALKANHTWDIVVLPLWENTHRQ